VDLIEGCPGESRGYWVEDLIIGMSASFSKTVTEADILLFSDISGDTNPVHLDETFAKKTCFKGRISHGLLSASLISAVIGTRLPGPGAIYVSQTLKFKGPVRAGDTVTARVTVSNVIQDRGRATLQTLCFVGEHVVIDGEAVVLVPSRAGKTE
jgi:3-hydroxybutyryl-CoA dehydratase